MKKFNFYRAFLLCCLFQPSLFSQISYKYITAQNINIGTVINWEMDTEANNSHFVVEKSNNGLQYFPIFDCPTVNNLDEDYTFLDIQVNSPVTFYRIKQIANDGSYSYSKIIEVQQAYVNNLLVEKMSDLNNPNNDNHLSILLSSAKSGILNYSIENKEAVLMNSGERLISIGGNELDIDFSLLPKGEYSLKLQMEEEVEVILIDKRNELNTLHVNLVTSKQE